MGVVLHISLQLANHKSQRSDTLKQELSTAKTYEHNRLNETSIVDRHRCHMAAKFGLFVDEDHSKLPTLYWLPKLHKRPYKSRFIANSSACTTTELSIRLTFCLTAIKTMSLRAVSHIHRIRTETVTATELHRFVFGRPFTYEPNPWTKYKKMPV